MATIVVIPPPVNVDVDEAAVPSPFAAVTTAPFDPPTWTDDGELQVTFPTVDLTPDEINAIINIAQKNAPPPPPEDVPPGTAPTPEVFNPGTKSLGIKWQAVANATSVTYDVYISDTPGAYDPANFLSSTAATMAISNTLVDGTPLQHGVTYYWQIQPRSGSAMGPVSVEVSGTLAQVNSDDIVAGSIIADLLGAGAVTSEKVDSLIVVSGTFTTAETGEREGISAAEGHFGYAPDGRLVFQVKGGNGFIDGEIIARSLTIVEGATWAGVNIGNPGGSTMMGNKLGAPGVAPTVEAFYDTITLDGGDIAGDDEQKRRGIVGDGTNWWVASMLGGTSGFANVLLLKFDAAGNHVATYDPALLTFEASELSLARIGSLFYMYATNADVVYTFDVTTGSYQGSINLAGTTADMRAGVLGSDGTNLLLAWGGSQGSHRWQKYSTSGAKVGGEIQQSVVILTGTPRAILGGSFDFGAPRVAIAAGGYIRTFDTSGAWTIEDFPSPNSWRGATWTGTQFATLASDRLTVYLHTANLQGEFATEGVVSLAAGNTWWDSTAPTHETVASPRMFRDFPKRAKYRITASGPVPSGGGVDDPNGVRFYVGRDKPRLKMERQGEDNPGAGGTAVLELASLTLPVGTADAVNPPPASNSFPTSTPYRHYSEATTTGGVPLTEMDGSGEFRALKSMQAGTITVTIPGAGVNGTGTITYDPPFDAPPSVTVSVANNSAQPGQLDCPVEIQSETASGCAVEVGRSGSGTSPVTINWIALAKTQ